MAPLCLTHARLTLAADEGYIVSTTYDAAVATVRVLHLDAGGEVPAGCDMFRDSQFERVDQPLVTQPASFSRSLPAVLVGWTVFGSSDVPHSYLVCP